MCSRLRSLSSLGFLRFSPKALHVLGGHLVRSCWCGFYRSQCLESGGLHSIHQFCLRSIRAMALTSSYPAGLRASSCLAVSFYVSQVPRRCMRTWAISAQLRSASPGQLLFFQALFSITQVKLQLYSTAPLRQTTYSTNFVRHRCSCRLFCWPRLPLSSRANPSLP